MQKAVNIILTLMSPTLLLLLLSSCLSHATSLTPFVTVSLISEKLEKKCASESFISKHVVQTHSEIQTGFVQKPLNISPQLLCILFAM